MTDPRRDDAQHSRDARDIRPLVGRPAGRRGVWIFAIGIAVAALALFYTLEMRRERIVQPALRPQGEEAGLIAAPPELSVPQASMEDPNATQAAYPSWVLPASPQPRALTPMPRPARTRIVSGSTPWDEIGQNYPRGPGPSVPAATGDDGMSVSPAARPAPEGERVQASRFANPGTTVPKGTVVQAVLETALDSTRPGFARGVVSRDVYGFDGTRILIPRGSRLIGEYKADLAAGQNRALILWQRLMRPDGVIVNLDSPAADPLGRAGVKGKVDSHFFERFGGAILQSTLDIGVQLATRQVTRDTVVVLPGGNSGSQSAVSQSLPQVQPTLKVRQGASVSVFVARDLDFTSVDR